MNLRFFIILIFLMFRNNEVQSQNQNAIYVEAGGNAFWYSLNYERQTQKGSFFRAGICYFSHVTVIPIMAGKIFGEKNHHVEIAGGIDLANNSYTDALSPRTRQIIALTGFIGYRLQNPNRKFFIKAGFTPIWSIYESHSKVQRSIFPWGGIGYGYRF